MTEQEMKSLRKGDVIIRKADAEHLTVVAVACRPDETGTPRYSIQARGVNHEQVTVLPDEVFVNH